MTSSTDRIEKQVLLHAPLARVWSAISDADELGDWFGVRFDGPFVAGEALNARLVPTTVDPDVAEGQRAYEGTRFHIVVEQIEPMRLLSFRWHPYGVDPGVDYSKESMTLVAFELKEVEDGTLLTVTESGFDSVPLERRAKAFEMNERGWAAQMTLIAKYLARAD